MIRVAPLAAALSAASLGPAPAHARDAAPAWTIDPQASAVRFSGEVYGDPLTGRFETFEADIRFDPDDLAGSSIVGRVKLDSIATGAADQDKEALKPAWLAPGVQAWAEFRSEEIRRARDGYEAVGTLSLKGIEQPLTLPFTVDIEGAAASAQAAFSLERERWDIGGGDLDSAVTDALTIELAIEATRGG